MSYEHFPRAGHRGLRAVSRVGLVAGLILAASGAHAFTSQASGIAGFTPSAGGLAGGLLTGGGFVNSAASRTAITNAAGKIITIPLQLTAGPTAGRVIAGACFANPVLCGAAVAGGALAAWFLSSKIYIGPDGVYLKDAEKTVGSVCWRSSAAGAAGPCFAGSYGAAESGVFVPGGATLGTGTPTVVDPEHQCYSFPVTRSSGITDHVEACADAYPDTATEYETRPATEADFDEHAANRPVHVGLNPENQIGWSPDAVLNASPVAVPVESPVFEEVSEPLSDPYPGTDPKVGPWYQDWLDVTGLPGTPDPLDLEVKPVTKPADNPNTPEDETPAPGGGGSPEEKPMEDPCKLHPDSVMCTELGTAPTDPVPRSTVNVSWTAEALGLPAGCPNPISVSGHSISYQSACDAMVTIRPIVILVAGLMALLIAVAAVRGAS